MNLTLLIPRPRIRRYLLPCTLLSLMIVSGALAAAKKDTMLFLRPHCTIPTPATGSGAQAGTGSGTQAGTGATVCPGFAVVDPKTLKTTPLRKNGSLDMDLVLTNPTAQGITRVRAWLLYNPQVLEGSGVTIGDDFPLTTPGEKNFSAAEGYLKIDASAEEESEPTDTEIVVARVSFRVKSVPALGKEVIGFYDIQTNGHTFVMAKGATADENVLGIDPSSLLVTFDPKDVPKTGTGSSSSVSSTGTGSSASSSATSKPKSSASSSLHGSGEPLCGNGIIEGTEECDDGNFIQGDGCSIFCRIEQAGGSSTSVSSTKSSTSSQASTSSPPSPASSASSTAKELIVDGKACTANTDCKSGLCSDKVCKGDVLKIPDGGQCTANTQCTSGNCKTNVCTAAGAATDQTGRTAFSILQVRNVRVTTEGSTIFLAWDPLQSSQLKGYNVYYGTTTGRYIQRKTVNPESTSMAIRAMTEGETYYLSVRALNTLDEESAFSQEVSVEVGNPKSSTSPLTGDLTQEAFPTNPLEGTTGSKTSTLPGETGVPSVVVLLLLLSAVTGTVLAARRQLHATTTPPHL